MPGLEFFRRILFWWSNKIQHTMFLCDNFKTSTWIGIPYCFFIDFTNFFLCGSMLLDFGLLTETASWIHRIFKILFHDKNKKHVNQDFHIASSLISQSSFFEKIYYLILSSWQRKFYGYIEIIKFDITIKKNFLNSN